MGISFDHLDDVKARYGLGAIAAVLRISGQTLQNSLCPTDHLGRWQENGLLAILVECNRREISHVGEPLRKMISSENYVVGDSLPVTISMGQRS